MNVIKSVSDLPEWFQSKRYRKALNAAEWYREIVSRTRPVSIDELKADGNLSPERAAWHWDMRLQSIDWQRHPNSITFYLPQETDPVTDLSIAEAFFLSESVSNPALLKTKERMINLLSLWRKEHEREDAFLYSYQYEVALKDFADNDLSNDAVWEVACQDNEGNPYLSYGRPLSGWPICIDTQYDDETIISHFKAWLAEQREFEGSKARRPFNENDFSDWENYRIRELHDLESWAGLHDVRILDRVLAAALWPTPADTFSPLDVLRTTARRKVSEVFRYEIAVRLYGQLRLQLGENFLSE